MQRSRKREFHDMRQSQNRQSNFDGLSATSSMSSSTYHPKLNPTNIKKEACHNCINRMMADNRRKQERREKRRADRQEQKIIKNNLEAVDPGQKNREKMASDAHNYNQQLIKKNEVTIVEQRKRDQQFAHTLQLSDSRLQEELQYNFKKQKQRTSQYRDQLYQQVQQEVERRKVQKARDNEGHPIVPLIEVSRPYDQQAQYRNELKRQIDDREKQGKINRQEKVKEDLKILNSYAQQEAQEDDARKKIVNPELFIEIREIQQRKLNNTLEKRRNQEKERKIQTKQASQARRGYIQEKMKNMQNYVSQLTQQISDKKKQDSAENARERGIGLENPYDEDQFTRSRQYKDCRECNQQYPAEYISPIPNA